MTNLQWIATEMKTGKVIADLPDLDGDSGPLTVKQTIGRYEQVTAELPIPTAPENWTRATLQGGTTLVLLQDDVPVWGGYISRRPRDAGDTVQLSLMTMEGYLDRRFVGDQVFTATGQNSIIQTLVTNYVVAGSNGGIPMRVQIVNGGVGTLRDRTYFDKDDKTVYSVMQDLSGVIGGPEWTIGWEHQTNPERYTPVLYIGNRIGSPVTAGMGANATFEIPGGINDFSLAEDFGASAGANDVMAYSSGQGDSRPQSPRQVLTDPDRPTFEYRYSPSTSISDVSTLTSHAQARLGQMFGGSNVLAMSAILDDSPKLGTDWFIGDDIGYQIGGYDSDGKDTVPSVPGGLAGIARAVGWELETSATPIITPILASADL